MSATRPAKQPRTPEAGQKSPSVAHSPGNGHHSRSAEPHWTTDPDHPLHIEALGKRCPLCHAQPGKPCQNITSRPLNRRIHIARTEIR